MGCFHHFHEYAFVGEGNEVMNMPPEVLLQIDTHF